MAQTILVCGDDGHTFNRTASTLPTKELSENLTSVKTSTSPRSKGPRTEATKRSDITGQTTTIQNTLKLILVRTNRQKYTLNNTIATQITGNQSTPKHTSSNVMGNLTALKVLNVADVERTQDDKSKIIGSTVGTVAALSGLVIAASFLRRKCKRNSVNPDTGDQSDTASISSDQPFFIPTEFSQEIASGTPAVKHSEA